MHSAPKKEKRQVLCCMLQGKPTLSFQIGIFGLRGWLLHGLFSFLYFYLKCGYFAECLISRYNFVFPLISVSAVAKKRPAFYGRILPVLLGLHPTSHVVSGVHVYGTRHVLKCALLSCLESKHPGAAPVLLFLEFSTLVSQRI